MTFGITGPVAAVGRTKIDNGDAANIVFLQIYKDVPPLLAV
jgi:hypothetical protein